MTKKQILVLLVLLACQLMFLCGFVFLRLIDYDEGSYLSAAYLVGEGKLPYLDFFYPQMPYLPYVYSLVSHSGLWSLFGGRLISAFAGLFLAVIFFRFVHKFSGDVNLSLLLFFLYAFNGLTINWHSVVKTLVFSDLFGFISFIFFSSYLLCKGKGGNLKVLLTGFFIGLAFNFRLTFFLILVVEGIMIFLFTPHQNLKKKSQALILLLLGALLSSPLAIYLFFKNPSAFIFGNIGYHQVWGGKVVKMFFLTKIFTLCRFLFYPQNFLIWILAILSATWLVQSWKKTKKLASENKVIFTASSIALIMIIICFFMSPTQTQYYEQALPYLVISSIPAVSKFKAKWVNKKSVTFAVSGFYLLFLVPYILIFIFALRPKDGPYEIQEVKRVIEAVQANSKPGEVILSGWPAYAVFSERKTVPGLETWGWEIIPFLSPEQKKNFKLIDSLGVKETILNKTVNLIVEEEWFLSSFDDLIKANYRLTKTTKFTKIYVDRKSTD
ncbi:MAG: hypothetical protein MUO91_01470 [candidate division Zixibacteria bacterium]|nr:hypothetical protein [candidate division Zixibacteria bacterium]